MLGHRLKETSQHSGVSIQPAFSQHSELGRSINPNSCLLGVGGGQSPPPQPDPLTGPLWLLPSLQPFLATSPPLPTLGEGPKQ